jgi:circadian clock protein KaiC
MTSSPPPTRVSTGVPGLDPILAGGLLAGSVYIVQGPPGSGKTILANQMCFHHASAGQRAVYVTLLAEEHSRMIEHLRELGFFRPQLVPEHVFYISAFKVLEADGLDGVLRLLRNTLIARQARVLVVDGLVSLEQSAASRMDLKKFVHELQAVVAMIGCTALLLSSSWSGSEQSPVHTMVDGILDLSDRLQHLRAVRHVCVPKLRGSCPIGGLHTLEISDAGIRVRQRFETLARVHIDALQGLRAGRCAFGVQRLDEMIGGGLPADSTTMLVGPSGCGKTILGLSFLTEGLRSGEPGLYFGFYERPDTILLKAERVGLPLRSALEQGRLALRRCSPVEGTIDVLGDEMLAELVRVGARRLFIDGLHGFHAATEYPERIRDVFAALVENLERLGVTTVYSVETENLIGTDVVVPIQMLSMVTHNILALRHVEVAARLHRMISAIKLRDSEHDPDAREFWITAAGVCVAENGASARTLIEAHGPSALRRKKRASAKRAAGKRVQRKKRARRR